MGEVMVVGRRQGLGLIGRRATFDDVPTDAPEPTHPALGDLPPEEKARRSASFGAAAADYERFRPGPAPEVVDWFLPEPVGRVVDLGAGTGALTRLLVGRVAEVMAVEPDERMRAVLEERVPEAVAVDGRAEAMPLEAGSVDAVLASSSWHWVDVRPALAEVARVLAPGGFLGTVWSGPDRDDPLLGEVRTFLRAARAGAGGTSGGDLRTWVSTADRARPALAIPDDVAFSAPEHEVFRWHRAMTAEDLVGLLGTFSPVLVMAEADRRRLLDDARTRLTTSLGLRDDATVELGFRADAFRARPTAI
jgi:SAM-dependent methyltransferase